MKNNETPSKSNDPRSRTLSFISSILLLIMAVLFITSKSIISKINHSFGKILKTENEIEEITNHEKQRKDEHEQGKSKECKSTKQTLRLKDINLIFCILTKTLMNWFNKFPRIQID